MPYLLKEGGLQPVADRQEVGLVEALASTAGGGQRTRSSRSLSVTHHTVSAGPPHLPQNLNRGEGAGHAPTLVECLPEINKALASILTPPAWWHLPVIPTMEEEEEPEVQDEARL